MVGGVGGAAAQWYGTIFPRVHSWLPTGTILEIGPGVGRWTQYLKDLAERAILVDLSEKCIAGCRARFAGVANITYYVNDGRSLSMIEDGTIDFAFSFDSLVHAEADVIQTYLNELASKMAPDGVGFIHHSNLGAYSRRLIVGRLLPRRLNHWLAQVGVTAEDRHWRAKSMTAGIFEVICRQAGLQCRSQEIITWEGVPLCDCLSVFTRPESRWARRNQILKNRRFMSEAHYIAARAGLYAGRNDENLTRED